MGKTAKKKKPIVKIILLMALLLVLAVELALFVIPQMLYRLQAGPELPKEEAMVIPEELEETRGMSMETDPEEMTAEQLTAVEFPLVLEEGGLTIVSLFQFDGINPDCGNEEKDQIATVLIENTSDMFLTEAKVLVEMADGTQISFVVTDLPAGRSAMVFSGENVSIKADAVCINVSCQTLWGETIVAMPEGIDVSVDGITITLTNRTGQDIPELNVYCRSLMGEEFFGGITYTYKIENLSANETAVVEAIDCIMGLAEVVRIAMN